MQKRYFNRCFKAKSSGKSLVLVKINFFFFTKEEDYRENGDNTVI